MTGPGTGQRRVAGQGVQLDLVDRVGGHHLLPLGPLGVADLDGDRAPWGRPWRTPPVIRTSSCSSFIRAPRP